MTVIAILVYPWIPLIDNGHWWFLVGGLTLGLLILAIFMSMVASGEANYEQISDIP